MRQLGRDCACAGPSPAPQPTTTHAPWQLAPISHRTPLPTGHALLLSPHSPVGPAVLNTPALRILNALATAKPANQGHRPLPDLPAAQIATLTRQFAALGLLLPANAPEPALCTAPTSHILTAWLHVTNACNLRCSYCYVDKDAAAMDEATGQAALETLFRSAVRHGFRALKLKYAGGEPTLNLPLVRTLHRQAGLMAQERGLDLYETMITNGVALPDEVLDFAAEAGLRLAVSLDISRQAHDAQRTLPDGRGTFDTICRNVERALQRGIQLYLSITLNGTAGKESADTVALALEWGLPFNLNFVRSTTPISTEQSDALIHTVRAAFALIEAHPPRHSLLSILDRANFGRPHRHTCEAGRSYLVIDHHGRISPCQMELGRPLGDLATEDPLTTLASAWANPAVEEREDCASCTWRYWCAGGCPWLARQVAGRDSSPSPYCAVYQALFPELLRLEGLRLLSQKADG